MKKMFTNKKAIVLVLAMTLVLASASMCWADGTADAAVVAAFTSESANMKATGSALIPLGLGLFTLLYGVGYAKKTFKKVAA